MQTVKVSLSDQIAEETMMFPAVSLIMPFSHSDDIHRTREQLRHIKKAVTRKVLEQHNDETGILVLQKLMKLCGRLNMSAAGESVAIYLSPAGEKLVYLDFPAGEHIVIGHHLPDSNQAGAKNN